MAPTERANPAATERTGERHSAARTAVVRAALDMVLARSERQSVLDIGGGTGGYAVRVARLGHKVTVVDPSPDALAALARRAQEEGVEVTGQQGDVSTLTDIAPPASADVVLCHGVLEVVDDPAAALATVRTVLRPGGWLSLLVSQRNYGVIHRAMAGHFTQALSILERGTDSRAGHRFTHDEVAKLVAASGLELEAVHGIRIFADLVPGSLLDHEPGAGAALIELEQAASKRPEFFPLAAQLHLLARRPANDTPGQS